jgi:hypothetical protein
VLPWRRRGDPPPATPCRVLLASTGAPFTREAIERAAELAGDDRVGVITIARLHGYAFGLPNPGLLPTRKERDAQLAIVEAAIDRLARRGIDADGEVAITRGEAKTIANTAKRRRVAAVVMDANSAPRWRRLVEGDPVAGVGRRLRRSGAELVVVGQSP